MWGCMCVRACGVACVRARVGCMCVRARVELNVCARVWGCMCVRACGVVSVCARVGLYVCVSACICMALTLINI